MLSRFRELGLLKSRGKARTDSTHILAAVKELTRLEHLEETLKSALNALALEAPAWLEEILTPDWYERYGQKVDYSKKARTLVEKDIQAVTIGKDGFYLLEPSMRKRLQPLFVNSKLSKSCGKFGYSSITRP